jgi:outer membrane protein assembly factor BamB
MDQGVRDMKKVIMLALAAAMVLAVCSTALAQQVNEWSQYQKSANHVGAIDTALPSTNRVAHVTDNIGAVDGSQPVVAGNRAFVYAGVPGASGAIYCYDLATGHKLWNTAVQPVSANVSWSSPAVADGVVYIGSGSKVQALDAASGHILWSKDLTTIKANADVVNSSPAIDGNSLIVGDFNNGCYYCLDITHSGALLWTFALDASCMALSTPCITSGKVFVGQQGPFGTPNGKVWCVEEATGKAVKSWGTNGYYATVGHLDVAGTVAAYGDFVYFTDFTYDSGTDCHLYCVSRITGAEGWKVVAAGSDGSPSVADGLVVTAGEQYGTANWVTAFSANTDAGKSPVLRWKKSGVGGYTMSACIAAGQVAVGNGVSGWPPFTATDVTVLDATSGSALWHSTEAGGPPVATAYGLLSIGDGKMTTFGTGALPSGDFYFAEGTTRAGYQEWICLENPGSSAVHASIDYMSSGAVRQQKVTLPPKSRTTVDVNLFLGQGLDVSAHVTGDGYFVAERSMYFNTGALNGGEQVMGVASPSTRLLYAEGTTRAGFQTWLALQNPQSVDANVIVTYLYADGSAPLQQNLRVGAHTRQTVDVNAGAGADKDVSIAVSATRPVVGERVMYFTYPGKILGSQPSGVHNCTGASSAGTSWYFAEGTTRSNFAEWLCLMNPRGQDTTATILYMKASGAPVTVNKNLKANSRTTVYVNDEVGPEQDVSVLVTSADPIVAERPMYFQYLPDGGTSPMWKGGHNTAGAPYAAYRWDFAEGCTRDGFKTFLCIANPNGSSAEVTVNYYIYKTTGGSETKTARVTVAANTRKTVTVNDVVGSNTDVSLDVTCGMPIVVERPMYFCCGTSVDGGVSLGSPGAL